MNYIGNKTTNGCTRDDLPTNLHNTFDQLKDVQIFANDVRDISLAELAWKYG